MQELQEQQQKQKELEDFLALELLKEEEKIKIQKELENQMNMALIARMQQEEADRIQAEFEKSIECNICSEVPKDDTMFIMSLCKHIVCKPCTKRWLQT